jgi:hypothetical protein
MTKIPTKVLDRICAGIKRFQPIIANAKSRDVGESDTVTIITDVLAEMFGYDKYSEITSEHAIRGTYCDLALKTDGALQVLIEAKAVGIELKDQHVKQAVDYAANQGVDWVVLTNAVTWKVFKVTFAKPIDQELVYGFEFPELNPRNQKDVESIFLLCKEGWTKSVLGEFHNQKQALNRFFLGALLTSDPILSSIRKELRKLSPDVRVELAELASVLKAEVIKREVTEGDQANDATRKIAKAAAKSNREKTNKKPSDRDTLSDDEPQVDTISENSTFQEPE